MWVHCFFPIAACSCWTTWKTSCSTGKDWVVSGSSLDQDTDGLSVDCVVEVLSCHSTHSSCLWRLRTSLCRTSNLLLQSSSKLLVDNELKHLHPQMLVGFNMLKLCPCRELRGFPLQNYFSGQFSNVNIDSLTRECVKMLLRFVSPITAQHTSSHRHKYIFTQTFGLLVTSLSDTVWGGGKFP